MQYISLPSLMFILTYCQILDKMERGKSQLQYDIEK